MEYNIIKKKIRSGLIRVALVYPSIYEAMASSLSSHMIYYLVNEAYPEVYVERFVARRLYGEEPLPRSLETGTPLRFFDLIITSIHYEPSIASLIRILSAAGISPYRLKRDIPVIAGGPGVMANPHPYSEIIDAFIIGEVEESLPKVMDMFLESFRDKKAFMEKLAGLGNIYVPGMSSGRVRRTYARVLGDQYYPVKQFYDPEREPVYGHGFMLESSRGCRFWCRFCLEGRLFKPYRARSYAVMKRLIEKGLKSAWEQRVIFYSLNFLISNDERRIIEHLGENEIRYSVPSLRFEVINEDILELLRSSGQRTITIAPESFSRRIQLVFGKYDRVGDLVEKSRLILDHGYRLKLYLISGFKGEGMDDIRANIEAVRSISKYARERGLGVTVTVNPLIPKPKTMYQWIGMIKPGKARKIINYYIRELGGLVDTRPIHVGWALIQASISLGSREISKTLIHWGLLGGSLGAWRKSIGETGIDISYVFRGYEYGNKLPWDNIVIGERVEELNNIEFLIWRKYLDHNLNT